MYQLFIKDVSSSGQEVYELPYTSHISTEELNVGFDAKLSLDYNSVQQVLSSYGKDIMFVITGGLREIWIEKNGTKVFYGVISDFSLNMDDKGLLKVDVACIGFMALFSKRRTGQKRTFTATEGPTIAWTLIDESQQSLLPYSNLGITQGATVTGSPPRDTEYRFANVKDEIVRLSNSNLVDGFDFDIDNTKKFNTFYPEKGSQRPEIVLDEENILSWGIRKPGVLSITNKVYSIGEGFNDDVTYITGVSSNDYLSAYKLLEDVTTDPSLTDTDSLTDRAQRYLLDRQSPRVSIALSHADDNPDVLDYNVGDYIKVKIPQLSSTTDFKRVYKRSISVDENGQAIVSLNLM